MCGDRPRATSAWVVPAVSYLRPPRLRRRRGAVKLAPLPRCNKGGGRDGVRIRRGSRETREKSGATPSYQVYAIITQRALGFCSGVKKALADPERRQGLGHRFTPRLGAHKWPTDGFFSLTAIGRL